MFTRLAQYQPVLSPIFVAAGDALATVFCEEKQCKDL